MAPGNRYAYIRLRGAATGNQSLNCVALDRAADSLRAGSVNTMGAIYDNSAFYYFFGVMLQFYLMPATYYNAKQFYLFFSARASAGKDLGKGKTVAERKKFIRIQEKRRQCKNLFTPCFLVQLVILILLWALFAFIMTLAAGDSEILTFDPYRILGVEQGAETRAIKRAYRKQSLIYHPDKNPGDKKRQRKRS